MEFHPLAFLASDYPEPVELDSCTHSRPEGVGVLVGRHGAIKPEGRACGRGGMPATLRRLLE